LSIKAQKRVAAAAAAAVFFYLLAFFWTGERREWMGRTDAAHNNVAVISFLSALSSVDAISPAAAQSVRLVSTVDRLRVQKHNPTHKKVQGWNCFVVASAFPSANQVRKKTEKKMDRRPFR
jgi:drug/metabolite transporter superfamily protein YnfA